MSTVLQIAYGELGVSWDTTPERVQEYIDASSKEKVYGQKKTHSRSWCTDFAYWVVQQAGLKTPAKSQYDSTIKAYNSTNRFLKAYPATKTPKPGDLYYMPYKDTAKTKSVWHIGFIIDAESYDLVLTLDGNSNYGNHWTFGMGGGWVCMNWRTPALIETYMALR